MTMISGETGAQTTLNLTALMNGLKTMVNMHQAITQTIEDESRTGAHRFAIAMLFGR